MSWFEVLAGIFNSEWWKRTVLYLLTQEANYQPVYPSSRIGDLCRALFDTPPDDVRVVILGQDPYNSLYRQFFGGHGIPYANGRAFAVSPSIPPQAWPPSLVNINNELRDDVKQTLEDGSLDRWAVQGIMLLNSSLSVGSEPKSHADLGWPTLTGAVLDSLNGREAPIVFVGLGKEAQKLIKKHVKDPRHPIIVAAHPSPLSAHKGFFGSKIFSKINSALVSIGSEPISWGRSV